MMKLFTEVEEGFDSGLDESDEMNDSDDSDKTDASEIVIRPHAPNYSEDENDEEQQMEFEKEEFFSK